MAFNKIADATTGFFEDTTSHSNQSGTSSNGPFPALTILSHPDPNRIGDRSLLLHLAAGKNISISRNEPEFAPPGKVFGYSLADPFISRSPLILKSLSQDEIEIDGASCGTPAKVQGVALSGKITLNREKLIEGVTIELANRVALLLHNFTPPPGERTNRFSMVGDSSAIAQVRAEIQRVADLEVPILLRGETGTGKELVARAIHAESPRGNKRFVSVNLAAIPGSLAASELFGAQKGAFTGAVRNQEGYFRAADKGILFLDEVGEAPIEVQVMLLRVLETGEIYPIGGQTSLPVDVRLVAATDSDLELLVHSGKFKAPLLHRLSSYEIWLPPLRMRKDDIGRLFIHFAREDLERVGELDRLKAGMPQKSLWLPASLIARMARYHWPGNVRQLRNTVRQLIIDNRDAGQLKIGPKIERMLNEEQNPSIGMTANVSTIESEPPQAVRHTQNRRKPADVPEGELIETLRRNQWDLKATAENLNISRTSLYALISACPSVRTAGDLKPEEIIQCHKNYNGDLDQMVKALEVSKRALRRRMRELGLGKP